MENKIVRTSIENAGLKNWQIAEKLGIHEGTFSRKLRHELSEAEKKQIFNIIDELKGGEKE